MILENIKVKKEFWVKLLDAGCTFMEFHFRHLLGSFDIIIAIIVNNMTLKVPKTSYLFYSFKLYFWQLTSIT